jgi:hypothetical protein
MKGAAKCVKHCELQNFANQWISERIITFGVNSLKHACFSVIIVLLKADVITPEILMHIES